ncbi:MAG: DUF1566 domain-containing protein [Bacteroidetes bacterium]|nr:DUF1566 domain-containing protein [Bacteroidota bacterium]
MKKIFFLLSLILLVTRSLFSQVAISNDNSSADNSAMLDVKSTSKGLLPPRVALTAISSAVPVTSPAAGLFIYNTAYAGTSPNNVIPGYYCWNGTQWIPVLPPQGTTAGDMLRWDGGEWLCLAPGNNGKALVVSSGLPTWRKYSLGVPLLLTYPASGITPATALSGGNVCDGGAVVTVRGMCWSTSPNPTTSGSKTVDGAGGGSFTSNLTGLTANTLYYTRAYATNSEGTGYGNEVMFTTGGITLTTTAASAVTAISATSGGTITSNGGSAVTARGVCWSIFHAPTTADSKTSDGSGNGTFTSSLTGLNANTTYYIRAYATNIIGTSYGNEVSFTTLSGIVTLTTTNLSCIIVPTAFSGGNITFDGGAAVTARGLCWSTSPGPTTANNITSNGSGIGSYTSNLTGLTASTQYYVRAYATNSVGTSYGNELSFSTPATPVFSIGCSYGGGIIFYIDGTAQHGLISATTNQSANMHWGCDYTSIPGTLFAIGTGQANTTAIVNGCTETGAARTCKDLNLNGYNDWFLPSKDELNQMYLQKNVIGGFGSNYFWTSSQNDASTGWDQSFSNGTQGPYSKFLSDYVRCIRVF